MCSPRWAESWIDHLFKWKHILHSEMNHSTRCAPHIPLQRLTASRLHRPWRSACVCVCVCVSTALKQRERTKGGAPLGVRWASTDVICALNVSALIWWARQITPDRGDLWEALALGAVSRSGSLTQSLWALSNAQREASSPRSGPREKWAARGNAGGCMLWFHNTRLNRTDADILMNERCGNVTCRPF